MQLDRQHIGLPSSGRNREGKQWLLELTRQTASEVGHCVRAAVLGIMDETKKRYTGVQHVPYGSPPRAAMPRSPCDRLANLAC